MATKIRLQRFGKKGKPVYHIVAADSRSKRDGRHIEKLGLYNPNTAPAFTSHNYRFRDIDKIKTKLVCTPIHCLLAVGQN